MMEIDIEGKVPYTDILLIGMRKSLKEKKNLTVTPILIKDVFEELGIK